MKTESGRSLIEVLGTMALGAIAVVGVIATYNTVRTRQIRTIAVSEMEQIAKNTKLLLGPRGDYADVSVDYLVKSGALKNANAPIGGNDWSITASADGKEFLINLVGLKSGDCAYLTTVKMSWIERIRVNGFEGTDAAYCNSDNNEVSLIIE